MTILIVDDKEENLYFLEALLKGNGYSIVSAANGAEALEQLRSREFAMIISDVLMPVMDGFNLCREVRADDTLKNIPFIFYTATYREKRDAELALKLGADRYLVKPLEPEELLKAIQEVLKEAGKERKAHGKPDVEEKEETFKLYSERLVAKLEKKMLDLEESEKKIRIINRSLKTLSRCNQVLIHASNELNLFNDICQAIVDIGEYQLAWVGLKEKDEDIHLLPAALAERKNNPSTTTDLSWTDMEPVRPIVLKAMSGKQSVIIKDILTNPDYEPLRDKKSGLSSLIALPLITDEKVLGVLNIFSATNDAFDEEEVSLLTELADDMAFGIMTLRARDKHKQAEQALERSEKMLRVIFDGARDGILGLGVQSKKFLVANETIRRMLGYTVGEINSLKVEDIHPAEALPSVKNLIEALIRQESTFSPEIPMKRKDGSVFFADISATLLELDGQPCLIGIFRDVTERRLMDEKLKKSEADYRDLYDNAPVGYHELDSYGIIVRLNQTEAQMLGYSVEELFGQPYLKIIAPQEREKVDKTFFDKLSGKINFAPAERKYLCKDGRVLDVLIDDRLIADGDGRAVGIRTTVRDISDLKQAEESRRLLSTAMEQTGEAVVITDDQGKIVYTNPAFEKITGYAAQDALGQNPRLLKSDRQDDAFYRSLWETITSGRIWRGRLVNRKKDGSLYHEDATISPVRDAVGRITNYVAVKRDVTQELELEGQLRQAQKMESIGLLAGGVAHDFNNILTTILGFSSLISRDNDLPVKVTRQAQEIELAAVRGSEITKQLLSFSRKHQFKLQTLDLGVEVKQSRTFLSRAIGSQISIECKLDPHLWMVEADATQIQQVLMNLSLNARDAMPDGGKIVIELSNSSIGMQYVSNHILMQPGDYVQLTFTDNGAGMDAVTLNRIFEPFFTTKPVGKGTGLGLPVVYGIMKNHKGYINVYSEKGIGTAFKLYFPRSLNIPKQKAAVQEEIRGGDETLFIVDDEMSILNLVTEVFEEYGYKCIVCSNPREALDVYGRRHAEINLAILDIIMPEMSGAELFENMKKINPGTRAIMSSGFSLLNEKILLEQGVLGFIPKPYDLSSLVKTVRELLDKRV